MNRIVLVLLFGGCVTHDNGCGQGGITSADAEHKVLKKYGRTVDCIKDDEVTYSCSNEEEERMYRCAQSASVDDKIDCIPWFPLE